MIFLLFITYSYSLEKYIYFKRNGISNETFRETQSEYIKKKIYILLLE